MSIFSKKKAGWECEQPNPDGSRVCRRFVEQDGQKMSTGTEALIGVNPDSCEPTIQGAASIMDEDREELDKLAKRMSVACRKGLA